MTSDVAWPDHLVAADLRGVAPAALQQVRERNFARMLDLVFLHHPYYKTLFGRIGLKRHHIASLADLHTVPVVTKSDFMEDPEAFRMRVDDGPPEWRILWDVMYTGGTSGDPAPFFSTTYDYYNILTAARRMLDLRGVGPDDVIANLNPMTAYPTGAYNRTLQAASTLGIPIFSPLPGRPSPFFVWGRRLDEVVRLIERHRATVLWGITSYIHKVARRAGELGVDLSGVRHAFVSGEATSEALRADLVALLEAAGSRNPRVSVSYGQTETQAGLVECHPGSGLHNPLPEAYWWEAVDPHTHEPLPDRQVGTALLTHLDRRGTVLLRYALGDRIALDRGVCPHCGGVGERVVTMPSRSDGRLKIKGTLIEIDEIIETVQRALGSADFVIIVDKMDDDPFGPDRVTVTVAAQPSAPTRDRIVADVKSRFLVTADLRVDEGLTTRTNDAQKRKLFVDQRPEAVRAAQS